MPCHPSATIAPTARIHPDSQIGPGCHIGEFVVIEQDVVLGEACKVEPYVFIKRWTTLGDRNEISAGTVLGSDPLDKNFKGERSYLTMGHDNKVREHFTISRGTKPEATTRIGDGNYIMTSGHIAHDCVIGHHNVICSSALIAGYVTIEDRAFISGGVVVHQYSKIGSLVMVGGNSRVNLDLPPYFLYSEFNATPVGLNIVGLRRAGVSREEISNLKTAYRLLYRSALKLEEACAAILAQVPCDTTRHLVSFIQGSNRGITRE
ncbi:MAG: acyl-ACP--UDP-N-acetylglucosamine O-acyltransferase [Acidobacteria bacterium]|nr:acyl-ACP--UDP-N-acetylglucosamine O-acyltransferase [Acidobacteriota bacterium]